MNRRNLSNAVDDLIGQAIDLWGATWISGTDRFGWIDPHRVPVPLSAAHD